MAGHGSLRKLACDCRASTSFFACCEGDAAGRVKLGPDSLTRSHSRIDASWTKAEARG
jgi:hypothetical protein